MLTSKLFFFYKDLYDGVTSLLIIKVLKEYIFVLMVGTRFCNIMICVDSNCFKSYEIYYI